MENGLLIASNIIATIFSNFFAFLFLLIPSHYEDSLTQVCCENTDKFMFTSDLSAEKITVRLPPLISHSTAVNDQIVHFYDRSLSHY